MPLIYCPVCGRITYAYYHYDNEEGVVTGYRCSNCYNVFNVDQVYEIRFPDEEIILGDTFEEFINYAENKAFTRFKGSKAEQIIRALQYLVELKYPEGITLYRDSYGVPVLFYAPWRYDGESGEKIINEEMEEEAKRWFANALNSNFIVVELKETNKGDSLFFAVKPEDVEKIKDTLKAFFKVRIL